MASHREGDQIDLYDPPEHCGAPMEIYAGRTGAYEVVCRDQDLGFDTNHDGVIVTQPTTSP
ncbi:hypothetical protein [Streptomyces sp. NBC_00338]|uniref:hypothetical protein n=1 Tax=Streptomyces sp. NBC_00338 TaxID=2975715 RepID=UPI0022504E89|nr:hypothetical protein [Streptomyces sp. NBC_00338]MCX5145120.1 hypothetical protein [Streptomyces sp. NBC_00338]